MKKKLLISMLLLFVGVSMQAQSIANEKMDERFNNGTKFPIGWFGEGWKIGDGKARAQPTRLPVVSTPCSETMEWAT